MILIDLNNFIVKMNIRHKIIFYNDEYIRNILNPKINNPKKGKNPRISRSKQTKTSQSQIATKLIAPYSHRIT